MGRFSVVIVGYGLNSHAACFSDVAHAMTAALRANGHEVVPYYDVRPGRLIMFGAQNILDPHHRIPPDAIVYNAEQVSANTGISVIQALKQYTERGHVIWDYSEANLTWLRERGARAVMCPIGYVPEMETIAPPPGGVEDIDVLFYGSVNPRRKQLLDAMEARGLRVVRLFGVYGKDRDAYIARSKIVLNLHFYQRPVFEIFRVSHLLANRKCVVSEDGGSDTTLEAFAFRATALVPAHEIADTCVRLVKDHKARRALADGGYEAFKEIDFAQNVEQALKESNP
jgi:hypothetical protein